MPRPEGEAPNYLVLHASESQTLFRFQRLDHHKLTHRTFIEKLDAAADFGEKGIVLTAANIEPRLHPRTSLPDDDRPPWNNLSPESLETQTLRIRIATVS